MTSNPHIPGFVDGWKVALCALLVASVFVFYPELAHAAGGLVDPLTRKGEDLIGQVLTVGKVAVGLAGAVCLVLALTGRIPWAYLGIVVAAGAGIQGYDTIRGWLNS